jgi:mevalonate kinase/isopentenyl-diphosphate delta-isomerase type 1
MASAAGKIILLGEHAVLYGSRALAAPLKLAVEARVVQSKPGVRLVVPSWGIDSAWEPSTLHHDSILRAIDTILLHLGITRPGIRIELFPQVPRAMGLGSSAAAAVAIIRGLSAYYRLDLDNAVVNRIAHEAERIIHGQSSGIDNSVACYSTPLLFQAGQATPITPIEMPGKLPLVVGISRTTSLTAPMVARVRKAWRQDKARYDALFRKIDGQVGEALEAIRHNDLDHLGHLMNANQRLLEALKVSTPELQAMIRTARDHGARGAKLTGGGGGGAMLALCPDDPASVAEALRAQGWQALNLTINAQTLPAKSRSPKGAPDENHQRLVQVDDRDRVTGYCTREQCHAGEGLRHRAFSIFIFDRRGRVLLQKRSGEKTLWPLFWSNSCCSHPRAGESTVAAAHRRLTEELGIAVPLTYLFKFAYQARYDASGSENELCSVFIGRSDQTIAADPREVDAWRYVTLAELDAELAEAPERFTPWLKLEWERLRHHPLVLSYQPKTSPAA